MTDPFPFFVGSGRSGTTLLRAIFDAHPDVAVPDEVSFIIRLSRPHNAVRYRRSGRIDPDALVHLLTTNSSFRRWGLPDAVTRAAVGDPAVTDLADAVRRLYAAYAAERGKSRYADKTPMHVQYLDRLGRLFPEARFVHVLRDGRDVACSYLDAPFGPRTVEEAAFDWRRRVRRGRASGARLGSRYREVRYEALVADPEGTVRSLCADLDLPFDPRMLRYHEHAGALIRSTVHPDAHRRLLLPPTPGLRDWRRELAPADVAAFESLAGDTLDALGYELAAPRGGPAARVQAGGRRAARAAARWSAVAAGNGRAAARQLVHGRAP